MLVLKKFQNDTFRWKFDKCVFVCKWTVNYGLCVYVWEWLHSVGHFYDGNRSAYIFYLFAGYFVNACLCWCLTKRTVFLLHQRPFENKKKPSDLFSFNKHEHQQKHNKIHVLTVVIFYLDLNKYTHTHTHQVFYHPNWIRSISNISECSCCLFHCRTHALHYT